MSSLLKRDWLSSVTAAVSGKKDETAAPATEPIEADEKEGGRVSGAADSDAEHSNSTPSEEIVDEEVQEGVAKQEAIALTWNKSTLVLVFLIIWLLYFVTAFQYSITGNLVPYIVSSFEMHSLIPVTYIVSNIMSGALRLPIAKMLDIWGRAQGFLVLIILAVVGLVMMAACQNVQTFSAAQVFTSVGFGGAIYAVDVITADSSSLRNRALAYAFTASPYIVTAFAGPKAAEDFYEKINYRWGFGVFTIITPVVAIPLFVILKMNEIKARKAGLIKSKVSGRSLVESIRHYIVEFDVVGVFIFAAGFSLFLLPFSLADSAADKWKSAHIIAMLVVGFVLIIVFVLVEKYWSSKPFLPFEMLTSRTILGTCLLAACFQIGYYCWAAYFSSYLQVVHGLTIAQAGYVSGAFDVVSGCWCFIAGFLVQKTKHFKWLLMAAVPLDILGIGLMIHFRTPGHSVGYVIMCQVFIALSGGTIILVNQIAVMAAVNHDKVAAALAVLGLFSYIGGGIGNSVSGAIWTNTFPQALEKHLPEYALANLTDIYGDLTIQLSYEDGDPIRDGILAAYGDAQRNMCICGVSVMALSIIWVLMIKNIDVSKSKQVKGLVW